jgi:hypothetical protein
LASIQSPSAKVEHSSPSRRCSQAKASEPVIAVRFQIDIIGLLLHSCFKRLKP